MYVCSKLCGMICIHVYMYYGIQATHVLSRDLVLSEEAPNMCVFGPNRGGATRFSYKWYKIFTLLLVPLMSHNYAVTGVHVTVRGEARHGYFLQ